MPYCIVSFLPVCPVIAFTLLAAVLVLPNPALAFECANNGAGTMAPDDSGFASSTACGDDAIAVQDATAVGSGASATESFTIALGNGAGTNSQSSIAVGFISQATGVASIAVGDSAATSGEFSVAIGSNATASPERSTAIGTGAAAIGAGNTTLGFDANAVSPHTNATALGSMAQDFHAAFGLGKDDKHISPRDMAGVALAAIKAQHEKIKTMEARHEQAISRKDAQIADLEKRLLALEFKSEK